MPLKIDEPCPLRPLSKSNMAYIRQMLAELRNMAKGENADMLVYLIEMAYLESGELLE